MLQTSNPIGGVLQLCCCIAERPAVNGLGLQSCRVVRGEEERDVGHAAWIQSCVARRVCCRFDVAVATALVVGAVVFVVVIFCSSRCYELPLLSALSAIFVACVLSCRHVCSATPVMSCLFGLPVLQGKPESRRQGPEG